MIYVGIDVAKDKHDCSILNQDAEELYPVFTISNNREGLNELFEKIAATEADISETKVGLEATGHYSCNLLGALVDMGFPTYVINPLHSNLYRKSLSLRKTKTDKVDAVTIAQMLRSDTGLKPYTYISYHNEELKSLTRYRFDMIRYRAKLKTSVTRLVNILFPELAALVPTLHKAYVYALLSEMPGASHVANCHLSHLKSLLHKTSKGRCDETLAETLREAARTSIGSIIPAKSLELKHTIRQIQDLTTDIEEIEESIDRIMDSIDSPITTIAGLKNRMGAMIIAEVGDFSNFDNADKILAYAGMSPSTYQSGQFNSGYCHMEKRGSRYLRFALFNATKAVCRFEPEFRAYLAKKRAEGKHYYVALSHATKKLVRTIYRMEMTGEAYRR